MNILPYLFAGIVAITAALAAIAIWSNRGAAPKLAALVLAGLLMGGGYLGYVELLGNPKPASLEWFRNDVREARVIAARIREGKVIYLWLEIDGLAQPRAYVLPWSRKRALELQKAMREAKRRGNGVRMRRPFTTERRPDRPLFHAAPQPALPPKPGGVS